MTINTTFEGRLVDSIQPHGRCRHLLSGPADTKRRQNAQHAAGRRGDMRYSSFGPLTWLLVAGCSGSSLPAPTVEGDAALTIGEIPVRIDVLHNDSADSVATFTDGAHGVVTRNEVGELVYVADPGFSGTDTFTYAATRGQATAQASVEVTVESGEGTVAGGQLYRVARSEPSTTVTEPVGARGFYWIDANNRGDAIGDYGMEDGSGLFVRWEDGTYEQVPVPMASAAVGTFGTVGLGGLNDDGVVTGWYFNGDYTIAGTFLWERGEAAEVQLSSESRDMLATDVNLDGTIVGYAEDYDQADWFSFIGEAGSSLDGAEILSVDGFRHTMLFAVSNDGVALGTVSSGGDGWYVTYPKDCFTLDLNDDAVVTSLLDRPSGVFHMDCRDINSSGVVVGKFYYGETNADRIHFHYALMHGPGGFVRIDFPVESPADTNERREELLAVTDDGVLYGNIVLDSFDAQTYIPLEFTPVQVPAGTSFDDTHFDLVGESWLNQ